MAAFILQFLFFCVFYPILAIWQWNDKKKRKDMYQLRINEAVMRGDKESAARYISVLTRMK